MLPNVMLRIFLAAEVPTKEKLSISIQTTVRPNSSLCQLILLIKRNTGACPSTVYKVNSLL